ncbi:hypothetical protein CDAR_469601 [Caerostris darwini]|uniref:Myostatin n=1 Tax=Caerostris darwini TaxID=1538125 RepID=A0AAV4QZT1_9ARAC|nr:hypothetical protein CDAR_469601 [Caerostris darwini]
MTVSLGVLLLWCHVLYAARCLADPLLSLPELEDYSDEELAEQDSGNCSRCGDKGQRRALRLDMIKYQILNQLGLKEAPNVTLKNLPHIPPLDSLLDHYAMQADAPHFVPGPEYGDDDDFYLSAEKVLSFLQPPPNPLELATGDQQLYFQLPSNLQQSQIQSSHLWIHLKPTRHTLHLNMTLYQVDLQASGQIDFIQGKITDFTPEHASFTNWYDYILNHGMFWLTSAQDRGGVKSQAQE